RVLGQEDSDLLEMVRHHDRRGARRPRLWHLHCVGREVGTIQVPGRVHAYANRAAWPCAENSTGINMREISFWADGEPKGQPRPRAFAIHGKVRMYDPA